MTINQETLELYLMNAHITVENYQPKESLHFLDKIDPDQLVPGLLAVYLTIKGQAKILLQDYAAGINYLREAIREFEKESPASFIQIEWARNRIGLAYYEQGNITQALEEHRLCLKALLERNIEDSRFCLKIFLNVGNDYLLLGRKENALECYRQALVLANPAEDREDLAALFLSIGLAYREHHNLDRAKLYLGKSLQQFMELGNLTQAGRASSLLGLVMSERGEVEEAEHLLKRTFGMAEASTSGSLAVLSSVSRYLALLYKQQKKWEEAEKSGTISLDYALKLGDRLYLSQAQAQLAEIKLSLGKDVEAFDLFGQAVATIEQTTILKVTRQIYYRYGTALRQAGQLQEAFVMLKKACLVSLYHIEPYKFRANNSFPLENINCECQ